MIAPPSLRAHCQIVRLRMSEGRVIPFLGAGANLCDRPEDAGWLARQQLPSGSELASYLAERYAYPDDEPRELVRVSQYVALKGGEAALFESLREIFDRPYRPNSLHELLAELPERAAGDGGVAPHQLIITTNYDDALEQAFAARGEPFDVVYYSAEHNRPGRFVHLHPDGRRVPIPRHTNYHEFDLGRRTVILKVHGAVHRRDERADSFVITEDHYIDYLARTNIAKLIPAQLMAVMMRSHFLFLGYGMRDWNLRVILHHIWSQQARPYASWAIERQPTRMDELFWQQHRVEIISAGLRDWVSAMRALP